MEVYRKIKHDLIVLGIAFLVFMLVIQVFELGKDDTDSKDNRSGLRLRINYGTGCQYLESTRGYLSPRLSSDGQQVCK
jgi:hypothetical protein